MLETIQGTRYVRDVRPQQDAWSLEKALRMPMLKLRSVERAELSLRMRIRVSGGFPAERNHKVSRKWTWVPLSRIINEYPTIGSGLHVEWLFLESQTGHGWIADGVLGVPLGSYFRSMRNETVPSSGDTKVHWVCMYVCTH